MALLRTRRVSLGTHACLGALCLFAAGCSDDAPPAGSGSGDSGTGTMNSTGATTVDPPDPDSTGVATSTGDDDGDSTGDDTTTTGIDPNAEWQVGFDVRNLDPTPEETGGLYLGGYGAPFLRGTTTGVHDSIYARSMAVGLDGDAVIFTIVDAVGMGNQWTREIRAQAAMLTGLSEEQIIVATTHSHSGPDFQGLWGGVGDGYRERVIGETVLSMLTAWDTRTDATLSVSNSSAANRNRRDWGFTDDTVFVLQAHDLNDDSLLGTMVAFAAHPVILGQDNTELSRDYCGYAVDALEDATGSPVLFFNGILGDVTPDVPDGMWADDFERAEAYGNLVSDQTVLMLEDAVPVDKAITRDYAEWELPVDNFLFNLAGMLGILDYDFDMGGGGNSVVTQTTYVRLGTQAQIIAFPGESLTRNGLAVKDAMQAEYKAVLGNAGDALGYFIPSDEWQTGLNDDYEEGVSLGESVGETTRDVMVQLIEADPF